LRAHRWLWLLLWPSLAWATTRYVDPGCTKNGDGTAINCAAADGGAGPYNSLANGFGSTSCGDTLNIRGLHDFHGTCPGTNGRYGSDQNSISKTCTAGNVLTIQANGYTTLGAATQESVYLEGTAAPGAGTNLGWTQCTDCSAAGSVAACRNIPGTCGDVWWTNDAATGNPGNQGLMLGAQKVDGSLTYRLSTSCTGASLTNQYYACTPQTLHGTLAVRWASATPNAANKPYVLFNNNGHGIALNSSAYLKFQGLIMRAWRRDAFSFGTNDHITISDNTLKYFTDVFGNGSDHAITLNGDANNITIDSNDLSFSGSELIHTQACCTSSSPATIITLTNNYLHDTGDYSGLLGPGVSGTPSGMILGDHSGGAGNGDYIGSIISGNVVKNIGNGSSAGRGIILENASSNWVVRDNLFDTVGGECIKLHATGGNASGNQIFNNIFRKCGPAGTTGGAVLLAYESSFGGAGVLDSNKVFNNTFIDNNGDAIDDTCNGASEGKCTNNVFRNNLFYKSGSWLRQINWASTTASNVQSNNLTWGPNLGGNDAIKWKGVNYSCTDVASGCSGTCPSSKCADPVLVNVSDYHIQTTSPAKDAGTSTGMPAARTVDINNSIAFSHGYANYQDATPIQGGVWDIGVDELISGGGGGTVVLDITSTDAPDPVAAGSNITYTLTYHNTGSATATGTGIIDYLPAGVTYVSSSSGIYFPNSGVVAFTPGDIGAGLGGAVTITVNVPTTFGTGSVIINTIYWIGSNETGAVVGPSDSTTVSNAASRRGRVFPGRH